MIKLENITVRMAGRTLIDGLSLTLNEGHRYGLIGRNGTGKSTFFKILLKTLSPDSGHLEIPARVRLGHIAQEAPSGSATPLEVVKLRMQIQRADVATHGGTLEKSVFGYRNAFHGLYTMYKK